MPHFASFMSKREKYPFFPPSIPEDLAGPISRFHGDPASWWLGQIVSYLTRPNDRLEQYLERKSTDLKFTNPIVG